ncbi:uncharacterized protein LOC121516255 isoform X2 [Cheilinus undulatus]|uniref:uncharacterized protein LOC121516255 isoform X2 n=1 Tax=Cheilinus undulatus TaxID=241271 RepID=UPI001BD2CBD6|nr:uncharacterized protein LOC121516255 isoform X2 [Cheilinus undulatus]
MSALLLLLSACVSLGLSYEYGDRYRIKISRNTHVIGFTPEDSSNEMVLWSQEAPSATLERYSTRTVGEFFSMNFDLESQSCNIYFIPSDNMYTKISLVKRGRLQDAFYDHDCTGFELLYPCGITNDYLHMSCKGRYEIRDENNDLAVEEVLDMESPPSEFDTSYIGIAVGVVFGVLSCCCCMRRCCCKKSSSKKDITDSPDAEPATYHHEYDHEPVRLRTDQINQPSETLYPTLPSYNLTTLIHNPPYVSVPPAYSEVSAPAEQADPPTSPVPSEDPEPRFELSFPLAPPLSSNSDFPDVYTSDKLNFN